MQLTGYIREDGQVGIRNHVVVLASVVCANRVVEMIAQQVYGVIPIVHQHGCCQIGYDRDQTARTLIGIGKNPNVSKILIVGLGCETLPPEEIAFEISLTGKSVDFLTIQNSGGTKKSAVKGADIASSMLAGATEAKRESIQPHSIILGTECGGSDTTSGLTANPAAGVASDLLIEKGATVILSETTELIGTEHILAKRAANDLVASHIYSIIASVEQESQRLGVDIRGGNPTPGNFKGGITTIEEKSLGCILKAGTGTIQEVVKYAERPTKKGLVIMDTPGHDIESITGMAAGGAQLIAFTTGRGTPSGNPIVPVIKICGNPITMSNMGDDIDIDASGILIGEKSLEEVGEEIFQEYIAVINGKLTKAEVLGHNEFAISRIAKSM